MKYPYRNDKHPWEATSVLLFRLLLGGAALPFLLAAGGCGSSGGYDAAGNPPLQETVVTQVELRTAADIPQAQAPKAAAFSIPQEFQGDMTVRKAVRLDTSQMSGLGPLMNGRMLAYTFEGEPLIDPGVSAQAEIRAAYKTRLEILDCLTGEVVPAGEITPMSGFRIAASLTGRYFYLSYAPMANLAPVTAQELTSALGKAGRIILQIDAATGDSKAYSVSVMENLADLVPLGDDSLLLHYFTRIGTEGDPDYYQSEFIDILDLTTGKLKNFYSNENAVNSLKPEGFVNFSFVSASEDRVYFRTSLTRNGVTSFGFRVYDSAMNFLDGQEVASAPAEEAARYTQDMSVSQGTIYYRITRADKDNSVSEFYQYVPVKGGYQSQEYGGVLTGNSSFSTANPRNDGGLDYEMSQGRSGSGREVIFLTHPRSGEQYEIALEIPGYSPPDPGEDRPILQDWRGDAYLVSGNSSNGGGADYYYIPKEEMERALYMPLAAGQEGTFAADRPDSQETGTEEPVETGEDTEGN